MGIIPRRGHFHLTQVVLPEYLERHFIRGFMDGDGSLSKKQSRQRIRFYGQQDILKWIRLVLSQELGTNPNISIREKTGIKVLSYDGGRQCRKIISWLYEDATIWLSRKYEIAMSWLK